MSLGPKKLLKTQIFEKKGFSSSEKKILAKPPRIIKCDKPQRPAYNG